MLLLLALACASAPSTPTASPEAVFVASEEWTGPAKAYPEPQAGQGPLACEASDPRRCRTDADCACGRDLASGACAFGTAACIDTEKPCPDFCAGIDGKMSVRCVDAQCVQVRN